MFSVPSPQWPSKYLLLIPHSSLICRQFFIFEKSNMWEKSLSLFEQMGKDGILQDEDCYSGAIWACVGGVQWQKAVELLKLMKFEGVCMCVYWYVVGTDRVFTFHELLLFISARFLVKLLLYRSASSLF
jgi:PPR repeat